MSERIEVGDIAQVVRGCGCYSGFTEKVSAIVGPVELACDHCGFRGRWMAAQWADWHVGKMHSAPVPWLRKIPPLTEPERTTEEATA